MAKYPNRTALYEAHNVYRDTMRSFIIRCLKKVPGQTLEDLISNVLDYEPGDEIENVIDINNIPLLLRDHWYNIFNKEFNADLNVQNTAWLISEGRNFWAHPGTQDLDSESTQMHLSLVVHALGKIKNLDAKQEVEVIRDRLFSDGSEEHPLEAENAAYKEQIADLSNQLAAAKAETGNYEERLKGVQDRLEEVETEQTTYEELLEDMSNQLEIAKAEQVASEENCKVIMSEVGTLKAEKTEFEERLDTTSKELKGVETEWLACEERLKTVSNQLTDAESEKDELEKCIEALQKEKIELEEQLKTMPDPLETEKVAYEKGFKAASKELASVRLSWAELKERHENTLISLEVMESNLAAYKADLARTENQLAAAKAAQTGNHEDLSKRAERPLLVANAYDSFIFQGTVFTKYMNKYHVAGRDIDQAFWNYWHAQRSEGKQEMRDAGWSVEKVEDKWEITVSPEDFQAWIENAGLTVQPAPPFYERVEQIIINFLADERVHRRVEIINLLAEHFSLNETVRSHLSKSGRIENHLISKGLIERTKTGYYQITAHGLELADSIPL